MKLENYHSFWETSLIKLCPGAQHPSGMSESIDFLISYGLPKSAAPFLGFEQLSKGLQKVYDIYGQKCQYDDAEIVLLDDYYVLGSGSGGNPIVINKNNQNILLLEHEDWLQKPIFINNNIIAFAEILLEVAHSIDEALEHYNYESLDNLPSKIKDDLISKLGTIDPECLGNKKFWELEIGML